MYRLFLGVFLFLLGYANLVHAGNVEDSYIVTGILKDSVSDAGEAFATLRVFRTGQESPVKVLTTDEQGKFHIKLKTKGTYRVQISAVGMLTLEREVALYKPGRFDLGTLFAKEVSTSLAAATVTAQRRVVKAEVDKITYSMKEDPEAQTSNLLDMLRKVPMVTVDGEDNIQVNGNSSFKVYVNGKPNEMMSKNASLILKNYPASMIKKIEVITDPGAKYDAEGLAGVLNIVTESNQKTTGYTFSPNLNINNRGVRGGVFGMLQWGKLMLSANYGLGSSKYPESTNNSEREVFAEQQEHLLKSLGKTKSDGFYQYGSVDGSYEFNDRNLLTLNLGLNGYNSDKRGTTGYEMLDIMGKRTYAYNLQEDMKYRSFSLDAGLDFQHTFNQPGRMLTLSYRLNTSPESNSGNTYFSDIENVPFELKDLYSDPDNKSYEHTAQVDFTTPFGKYQTLSSGLKYVYRINKSNNVEMNRVAGSEDGFVVDDEASLLYRHRTDIMAAYTEYGLKVSSFSMRAGVRYEYSKVDVDYPDGKRESFDSDFNDWVPTFSLGYNLSPAQLLKANYNLRIGRPSISYLSPYVQHNTPQSITYGQPDLDSEEAHNFSLGYSYFQSKISISSTLSYALSNNGLATYSFVEDGIQHTTYGNSLHSKVLNLSTYINWMITKGTSFNLNANVSYSDYKVYQTQDHNSGFAGSCFGGFRQNLPYRFKLSLWGGFGSPRVRLQGEGSEYHYYSVNLSRSFLRDDALTLSVNVNNFLDGKRKRSHLTETADFRNYSAWESESIRYGVGIRYRLGKLSAKIKKAAHSIKNTDMIGVGTDGGHDDKGAGQEMK